MARVTVDQKALSDPRFRILGSCLQPLTQGTREDVERAFGLYLAIRVWDYCTERGLLVVHGRDIEGIYPGLADALIDADLAEKVPRSKPPSIRIRGGEGRLDWLERKRNEGAKGAEFGSRGAEYGKLGGRPKKTPLPPVSETPIRGDTKTPPLTLSPALAPSQETTTSSNPPPADLDTLPRVRPKKNGHDPQLLDWFGKFYGIYPRHEGKAAALKAFLKLSPDKPTLLVIADDIERRVEEGSWQPDDKERVKYIPLPATYLNGRRWEDSHA